MDFEIVHARKRSAVWFLFFLGTAAYLALTANQFLAKQFSEVPRASYLRKAIELDPSNAEYRDHMGRFQLLVQQSPADALPWLQAATSLNPNRSEYWLDRATAEHLIGNFDSERNSLDKVSATNPHSAEVAWQVANLYLSQNALEPALREYRKVLESDSPLSPQALQLCWRVRPDIDFVLQNVVPDSADERFLSFLVSSKEPEAAAKVWERIVTLQQPVERRLLFDYLRYLSANHDPVQASRVWQQAANLSGLAAYQPTEENLLVNGDFSLSILNNGFDWIYQKSSAVSLAIDPDASHFGSPSLRIVFHGPGIEDAGIRQLISVDPDTGYVFSGSYKAAEMDGVGAPKFAIQDVYSGDKLFLSDDLRDAESWTSVNGSFTTGPETHLIVLRVARVPADRPIRGKLWINGLKLVTSAHAASVVSAKEHP
ncbi:MAG: tetratricopeptide repeat protein [Terriglobales bacterium]